MLMETPTLEKISQIAHDLVFQMYPYRSKSQKCHGNTFPSHLHISRHDVREVKMASYDWTVQKQA